MTLEELYVSAQNKGCYLTIPRKNLPKGLHIRFLGRSGPLGRICCVNLSGSGYEVVACFDGPEVTKWLDGQINKEHK